MTQDTEDVVARLRAKATWNDYSSCDRDDFVEAADLIQSLSDRIDVLEAERDHWKAQCKALCDVISQHTRARAALHQEGP